jgi:hypothetical protein
MRGSLAVSGYLRAHESCRAGSLRAGLARENVKGNVLTVNLDVPWAAADRLRDLTVH